MGAQKVDAHMPNARINVHRAIVLYYMLFFYRLQTALVIQLYILPNVVHYVSKKVIYHQIALLAF